MSNNEYNLEEVKQQLLRIIHYASLTNDIEELKASLQELEHYFPEIIKKREWALLRDDSEAMLIIIKQLVKVFSALTVTFTPDEFQDYIAQLINGHRKPLPSFMHDKEVGEHLALPVIESSIVVVTNHEKSFKTFQEDISTLPLLETVDLVNLQELLHVCMQKLEQGMIISDGIDEQTKMMLSLLSGSLPKGKVLVFNPKTRELKLVNREKTSDSSSTVLVL